MYDKKQMEQFAKHYKTYFDKVYRFVFWRSGTRRETAEDLCGEIWLKAMGAFPSFDQTKSFTPWIMTIAKNHVLNFYRTRGREVLESELVSHNEDNEQDKNIFEILAGQAPANQDKNYDLYSALGNLEDRDREIIELKYLEGFSHKEIGALMGESEVAMKVAAHRAIKKLKNKLKDIGDNK